MKKIKAIIFDLDNTLYDERKYYEAAIAEFSDKFHLDRGIMMNAFAKAYPNRSRGDILGNILFYSGLSLNLQEAFFEVYKSIKIPIRINPHVGRVLARLKDIYMLFILTNGNVSAQKNKIALLGLERLFDEVVYAREFKKEKPCCSSLFYILNKWSLSRDEVMLIGDNEFTDGKLRKCGIKVNIIENFFDDPGIIFGLVSCQELSDKYYKRNTRKILS